MRCGRIFDYLTWLSYEDWPVWNARALLVAVALVALHDTAKEHIEESVLERQRQQKRLLLLRMKQRSRWNSFLMASRRRRLIAILLAVEIAMYIIILIVAKFGDSSGYFHVNSFVLHYSKLDLHVCSLCLLHIPTSSHTFTLRKFTLCNTWRRPHPTTFHPNPLLMHLQMWIGSMRIQSS